MNPAAKTIRELEAQRNQIESAIRTLRSLNGVGAQGTKRTYHLSAPAVKVKQVAAIPNALGGSCFSSP